MNEHHPNTWYSLQSATSLRPEERMALMARHRYFLWLSPNEGFCLPLLEAMACGCTVAGFHPRGESAFLTAGIAGATAPYPDFSAICAAFSQVLSDAQHAQALARAGQTAAQQFESVRCQHEWRQVLKGIVADKN